MRLFGLIGYPLSHSFSKPYFNKKFKQAALKGHYYESFPIQTIHQLPQLIKKHPDLAGLNVTIPYKEQVIPFLDELSEEAKSIGAVNTIHIEGGKLIGHNTDVHGFSASLRPLLLEHIHAALILGTGGASKAVAYVLDSFGIPYRFVSRKPSKKGFVYTDLNKTILDSFHLIINTTPLGMAPNVDNAPDLPYTFLQERHLLYDLIYNPEQTSFLKQGLIQRTQVKNGLEMLFLQAERSWEIWNNATV